MAEQQTLDNNELLSAQRAKINNNALDAVSQARATTQDVASSIDLAAGKRILYDGVPLELPVDDSYTATLTPSGTGSITLAATNDILSHTKDGQVVTVVGFLGVSAISSPIGTTVALNLPYSIIDGPELSGRTSVVMAFNAGGIGVFTSVIATAVESATSLSIRKDASMFVESDQLWVNFTYLTGE